MHVNQESYFDILHGILNYQINGKQVLLLFFFCSDIATLALMESIHLFKQFIDWSLAFMIKYICPWVQFQGGWVRSKSFIKTSYLIKLGGCKIFFKMYCYI